MRGSVVLEQIDLSFAGKNEDQYIEPEPKISEEVVLPILESIISTDGCSLKHIQFPCRWRARSIGPEVYLPLFDFLQQLQKR